MKDFGLKISKGLLFLLLLLLPTQLGRHFWFDWSLVWGVRIDYLSPTLYLVDLIWMGLLIFNFSTKGGLRFASQFFNFKNFLVLLFVLINILVAENKWIAVYKWARLGELVWFGWYVYRNKKLVWEMLKKIIPIWLIVESSLALGQIAKGGSLNGWWWFLGERKFDFNTIGIAQMSVVNTGLVRAYGTFSHPNSLAGFLLVSLVLWIKTKSQNPLSLDKLETFLPLSWDFALKRAILKNVMWWGVVWFGLMGICLSGSRTIWCLTVASLVWWSWGKIRKIKNKGKISIIFLGFLFLLFKVIDYNYPVGNFLGGWDENGLIKRGQLNLAAVEMIRKSPWVGVGLGNFLVNLPEYQRNNQIFWFQPVHNILLLLVSEMGLLGLMGILVLIREIWGEKEIKKSQWCVWGIILLSGMVDHYWFTLPQNMWLLALVLGLI